MEVITAYAMKCARCGKYLRDEDQDIIMCHDPDDLRLEADSRDWITQEGKDYCPDCLGEYHYMEDRYDILP